MSVRERLISVASGLIAAFFGFGAAITVLTSYPKSAPMPWTDAIFIGGYAICLILRSEPEVRRKMALAVLAFIPAIAIRHLHHAYVPIHPPSVPPLVSLALAVLVILGLAAAFVAFLVGIGFCAYYEFGVNLPARHRRTRS